MIEDINNPNYTNYRKRAFRYLPHKCALCSFDTDFRLLEVHHINENHQDNRLDNLMILCPTCHKGITLGYYILNENNTLSIRTDDGNILDWELENGI